VKPALPLELLAEQRGDVGIDVREAGGCEVLEGLLRDGHDELSSRGFPGLIVLPRSGTRAA
jgi:hypothetical protein